LHVEKRYVLDDELEPILSTKYDYVVDAIDTLRPKINLIAKCLEKKLPIVSSMGAGGRMDPTMVEVADISKSHHCPLAHVLRKKLHRLGIRKGFKVVFSPEPILEGSMILCDNEPNKKSIVGTVSYMPASFGIACASVVVKYLTEL
jgi:tRNA A37 threonylcarbamoyladenosine dehydratase